MKTKICVVKNSGLKAFKCAFAFVLTTGLMMPVSMPLQAYAADDADAGNATGSAAGDAGAGDVAGDAAGDAAKDEVVYVKADAGGATQGIYVVNIFDTDTSAQVKDPANYESVTNLSTTQTLEQKNGEVEVSTTANEPFYYQGIVDKDSSLPWDIDIRYYLDGKEIKAENLAGASGQLKVVLKVEPVDAGEVSDFSASYILQAQGTFAEDAFAISDGGDATIAHSGSNQVATCLVLPGEAATFEVTGTAQNFSYDGWQIVGMPLSLAIDLSSQDTSELTEQTEELESATSELSSGASELASASEQIDSGAQSLASGSEELSGGIESAASGLGQLSSESSRLTSGWDSVSSGVNSMTSAINSLKAGNTSFREGLEKQTQEYASSAAQLSAAQTAYARSVQAVQEALATGDSVAVAQAVTQMNACAQTLAQLSAASGAYSALNGVLSSYTDLGDGIDTLADKTSELSTGAQSFGDGLSSYVAGVNKVSAGATELQSGAAQVAQGANKLSSATGQFLSGTQTLASGTETLASSVSGIDQKILDELQNTIDEKLGKDFKAHSYVVPDNTNVDAVQFVYVVEGVSEAEDAVSDTSSETSSDETFFDRLVALFVSQE